MTQIKPGVAGYVNGEPAELEDIIMRANLDAKSRELYKRYYPETTLDSMPNQMTLKWIYD